MARSMTKECADLVRPLQFETLLVEISTLFINLTADKIDSEIKNAQRTICEFLDLDRSTLWQVFEEEPGTMLLTHFSQPQESVVPPEKMNLCDFWPWALQKMNDYEVISFTKITDLPEEAERDRDSWSHYGTKSGVYLPLSVGKGPVFGVLTFAAMREERVWPEEILKGCMLLAQLFSNALARKKSEIALRENEECLTLATNAAGAGLWSMNLETGDVWVSSKTRELLNFPPHEDIHKNHFYNAMHPEDPLVVKEVVEKAILTGEYFACNYRVLLPDGNIRWITARGQRHPGPADGPDRLLGVLLDISTQKEMELQLEKRLIEIEDLKQRLEFENTYLQEEVKLLAEHSEIIGESDAIKKVISQARQVAQTDSTVFILGETGTGKELLARAIHGMSRRNGRPLVTINCASLPPSLIENELFGREKGAYTGALTKMIGRFELADGSTLFLDEIGELPLDLQSKLLRVLETGQFERLGSTKARKIDIRIIVATNRVIEQEIKEGTFRQDLFYRLNVFPILIPPLCDRSEDIPLLVRAFVREFGNRLGKQIEKIPYMTMQALKTYHWPGNVRELRNLIERAIILTKDTTLRVDLPQKIASESETAGHLEELVRREILAALKQSRWRVAGEGGAADLLGLKRSTLYSKMKKLGIRRPNSV